MKTLTLLLVFSVFVIYTSGYLIKVPTAPIAVPTVTGHTQWVQLQKLMIPLFENVCETSSNSIICRLAQEFTYNSTDYLEPDVITNLQRLVSTGLLPKGTIFTEYDPNHMNEMKIMYEVLYNAKDFDVFYKAAAWMRQNLNCALYVNAIYMAIQNRRDTERLSIPAPYELLPNYFINKDVIIQVSSIIAGEEIDATESIRDEGNAYTIDANYTALFYDNDGDSKLAYFREDIGLNSYYFLRKLRMAPWFNNDVNGDFGENMYQMMKQFLARYNLERYANGLPEIDSISWNSLTDISYDPMLLYSNGNEFGHRTSSLQLSENETLLQLITIENNIVAVVSHMRQSGYNKPQILNHLMEILVTGDRSYETLARQLLGKDLSNIGYPSVLEHYMTSLRDPMFWRINKKIVDMVDEALKILPTYERNELYFPGVEVVNIDVKKIMTTFDYFEFDVTEALKIEENASTFRIKIGQPRLNHKPFTIRVNVSSLVSQKGIMKIYLGPKLMPGELAAKKNLFTLLDIFEINLKIGSNIITRSSENMRHFSEDFMLLNNIRKKVEDAEFGLDSLPFKTIQSQVGYPSRLILPKGTSQGLPLQMFVFVAPYVKPSIGDTYSRNSMELNTAVLSPGYPLDLMIEDRQLFGLPNAMIKYITVSQKGDSKVENYGGPGVTKSWYGTDDMTSRSNYNSRNAQYGGNTDYSVKVNEFNVGNNDIIPGETLEDNYYVIGLNDMPNLLKTSRVDHSLGTKLKQQFDYKAKKAQFDKKDYSAKKDYSKYRTKTKVDDYITSSTPLVEILRTTENVVNVTFDDTKADNVTEEYNVNVVKDLEIPINKVIHGDLLKDKVESLPLPAMLKKDPENKEKFDFKTKKTERDYKIKVKKVELDSLIKDAKRIKYSKNVTVRPIDETSMNSNINIYNPDKNMGNKEERVLDKNSIKLDREIINDRVIVPVDKYTLDSDINSKENIGKVVAGEVVTNLQKIKSNKIPKDQTINMFDKGLINSDVPKHINSDKNIGKPVSYNEDVDLDNQTTKDHVLIDRTTATDIKTSASQDNKRDLIIRRDNIELDNEISKDDINIEKRMEISHTDLEHGESTEEEPIFLLEVEKNRSPTVYDYLMQAIGVNAEVKE